jgi:lysophospholipase L1-like esterase
MAKRYNPNVVIIMLGTNDSKPQNWAHSTEIAGDMATMVKIFKDLPSKPEIIVVMPVPVFKPAFGITEELLVQVRPLLAQGAKQAGATVVESTETFTSQEALFPDGVHPNEKGAEMIGQLVLKNLPAK